MAGVEQFGIGTVDADRALLRSTYPGMLPAYVPGHAFKKVVFEGIID